MAMAWLWTGMVAVSLIFGALTGNLNALSAAALEGAQSAVELCLTMCGVMCLWTGVMEVMNQCHLTDRLASLFRPLLKRLLPNASGHTARHPRRLPYEPRLQGYRIG